MVDLIALCGTCMISAAAELAIMAELQGNGYAGKHEHCI